MFLTRLAGFLTGTGSIAEDIGAVLLELLDAIMGLVTGVFTAVVDIFWSSTAGLTIYGVLLLMGFVVAMIFLAIGTIRGLIGRRSK